MPETESLSCLQKQRSKIRGNITRIKKMYQDGTGSLDQIDMQLRLEILDSYIKQLMDYQTEIEKLNPDDNKRGELEEVCIGAKSILLSKLGSTRRTSIIHDYTMSAPIPPANRLPHLRIPKFNGKYSEYQNFITCFNNLVNDDPTLSTIEKFNHLVNSLQDDALCTVRAFQVNEQNYSSALKRLAERYDNKCLIFQDHIASLFNLKKITKPCSSDLRHIVDTVSAILDSLSHIGTDKDITNALIIHLVLSKLDQESKAKWDEQLDYTSLPKWSDCASVLIRRCQFLDVNDNRTMGYDKNSEKQNKFKANNNFNKFKGNFKSSLSCIETKTGECSFCSDKNHNIEFCPMFGNLQITQRFEYTKKNGLCINCLKPGHTVRKCRGVRCNICQRPHHFLLHNEELIKQQNSSQGNYNSVQNPNVLNTNSISAQCLQMPATTNRSSAQCNENPSSSSGAISKSLLNTQNSRGSTQNATAMYVNKENQQVILATAMVQIRDKGGRYHLVRALLDSGSQINLVTEEIAQCLSLKRIDIGVNIIGIGNSNHRVRKSVSTYIKSCINEYEFPAECFIIKTIVSKQPNDLIDRNCLGIPANLVLADPKFNKPRKIDILIGAESFFDILSIGQIKLGPALPILQKTLLGWVVSGRCEANVSSENKSCHITKSDNDGKLDLLNSLVEKFWEIEQVPMCSKMTEEQKLCENHFEINTRRIEDGKFEVRLPFKLNPDVLGNSYEIAKRRFLYLERKLLKDSEMREMYTEFMKEYLNLEHMSLVNEICFDSPHYFIPQQCIIRAHSTTTKLRVVFDASSKTSSQISLNDTLMVGPTIQEDLFSILLKFRLNKFAITADITKMYRQVNIHKDDRKFQLILWRENPYLPIQTYALNTVTYGTASAPFLAIRCLKEISNIFRNTYPLGSNIIANDFYVDDLLTGADDIETLSQIHREVTQILGSCGFKLSKWHSNCNNCENVELIKHLVFENSDSTRALGIIWKPDEDNLCFEIENNFENVSATKRNILSISSRLFDPLGLLAPIIIRSKILLQEIWENNLDWDESIPQNLDTTWRNFTEELSQIKTVVIPRYVGTRLNNNIQIHGFADASMRAYGCCIYVRHEDTDGIEVKLLVAKSKVAPSKKIKTLPRLELCAAHLLVKLWNVVMPKISKYNIENVTFWSDSEIVLYWIKTHPSQLLTFVSNRVSEIQEYSSNVFWRYVPTSQNPADIVSRGCDVNEIKTSIWFSGPEFLRTNIENWPKNDNFDISEEMLTLEKKKTKVLLVNVTASDSDMKSDQNQLLKLVDSISSYKKIIRIVAYVLRFIKNVRKKLSAGVRLENVNYTLTVKELDFAFLKIVEMIQSVEFKDELRILSKNSLPRQNKIQKLNPFIQKYEIDNIIVTLLRVGGRLNKSLLPYESKHPLLLTRNSHFIKTYFSNLHKSNCHVGPKALIGLSREKVWVIGARQLARNTVNNCIPCFHFQPKLASQIMGDLPRDRITSCRPFLVCGVDLCGPIYTSLKIRGKGPIKTYIAVFVCFSSKAVHLEALTDLQTDTFLSTFNRFVGRRGLPKKVWCDNATNFIGTARLWSEKEKGVIQQTTAEQGIEFRFIPPRAPHFGGLWEAAVKSAKTLMLRTIGQARLTYEELTTVLVDVEAVLNSRPIVALTEDANDEEALTPGHLLIGSSLKAMPEIDERCSKGLSLKRFRQLSLLKGHFWDVWQRDYVRELQQRTKWTTAKNNLKKGDVVIVLEDNLPPQKWLLGRIIEVEVSSDDKIRVVTVKTKTGTYRRPIHKLAPLPFNDSQASIDYQPCKGAGVEKG